MPWLPVPSLPEIWLPLIVTPVKLPEAPLPGPLFHSPMPRRKASRLTIVLSVISTLVNAPAVPAPVKSPAKVMPKPR